MSENHPDGREFNIAAGKYLCLADHDANRSDPRNIFIGKPIQGRVFDTKVSTKRAVLNTEAEEVMAVCGECISINCPIRQLYQETSV